MTTVAPVTATPTSPTTSSSSSGNALNQLSGNFDTFLQLLTTQLQNQDPTSPMDTNQFTQQLVEYSQVEQQISTNSNLQTLINLQQGQSTSNAVSYLGKTVTLTNGQGALTNGSASWNYSLSAAAANATLSVSDANGNVVYTAPAQTGTGAQQFTWNGQNSSGNQLPDGAYTLKVTATDSSGAAVTSQIASSGVVTQIDLTGTAPQLMIGTMEFPLTSVSAVHS